jgi:hypothetical protein
MIFDSLWGHLNDPFKDSPNGLLDAKKANVSLELAKVEKYYPELNEADVTVLSAGLGDTPARMLVQVHYQGDTPGTGETYAFHKGQLVIVAFLGGISDGFGHQGIILGTLATRNDHFSPKHPMITQADSITRTTVDPGVDGEGNVTVVEKDKVSKVTVNDVHHEKYGSESESHGGPVKTYTEKMTQQTASVFKNSGGGIPV